MADVPPSTTIYDLDYFSGSQMFLYVGDVWVDEVTSLQCQVNQTKQPIYGYASQLWDDCAAGQVIVTGQFTINFKESGYLWAILRRYKGLNSSTVYGESQGNVKSLDKALFRNTEGKPVIGSNVNKVKRASIERVMQGNVAKGDLYKFYQDLAGFASYDPRMKGKAQDTLFEDVVEVFEDQIWAPGATNTDLNAQIRRSDEIIFDGFDIYVVFGNYAVRGANHTVLKLVNVRLINKSMLVKIDGEPVQEAYQFIAQNLV